MFLFLLISRALLLSNTSNQSCIIYVLKEYPDVLSSCLSNALHTLYFYYYVFSLGVDRFNNIQLIFCDYLTNLIKSMDIISLSFFAIQLNFLVLDANTVLTKIFTFMSQGLSLSWKKELLEEKQIPRGKELMFTYFMYLLLSVVYNHNMINHDIKEFIKERVIVTLCSSEIPTIDTIIDSLNFMNFSQDVVYDILKDIADSSFNRRVASVVYSPKLEVLKQFSIFSGYHNLFSQNELLDVKLLIFPYSIVYKESIKAISLFTTFYSNIKSNLFTLLSAFIHFFISLSINLSILNSATSYGEL